MVETPVRRRSRRIQNQSDDETSVASSTRSRGSRSSRASNASSVATPTRRNTRARAAKGGSSKELEAIPEAPTDRVEVATSTKKKKKSSKMMDESKTIKDEETKSNDTKSSARKNKKVPPEAQKEAEDTTKKSEDPTPTKSSKKKQRRKESLDSKEGGKSAKDHTSKLTKNAIKRKKKHSASGGITSEDKTPKPSEDKTPKPSEDDSSRPTKNALKRLRKSNPAAPELQQNTKKTKDSPKKIKPPKGKRKAKGSSDKSSTKKQTRSPHKKQQSPKHKGPSVSPSPKRNLSSKLLTQATTTGGPKHLDVKVHRLTFLKLHQRGILAMASTPLDSSSSDKYDSPARLAISREGGSVELVSPQDRWITVGNVPGVRGKEVDALVWVCGKRGGDDSGKSNALGGSQQSHRVRLADEHWHLIGCSRDSTIFELDFATKRQKGVIGSGGGGVFCLASCGKGNGGYFAAGCEDGTVKIYTIFDSNGGDTLSGMSQLVATLPSAGQAVLSLAWVPGQGKNDDGGMGGSVIFAGVADGTIRRFDCTTSIVTGPISTGSILVPSRGSTSVSYRWKSTLRMTVENRGLRESTKVWALKALSDGTVISGDSLGHVQIWDGMSGTMTQTFDHNESGAHVLCLAVSEDENKIFASGIDSSVRCIQRQASPSTIDDGKNTTFDSTPVRKWISSNSHRKHSHDVKALAICHKTTSSSSKPLELLVSGSVDTRICTYLANDFKSCSRPKIWFNWPSLSPISVSRKHRLLAVTRNNCIDLYRLTDPEMSEPDKTMNPEARDESKCLVKTISIESSFNLTCSAISEDGKFLAVSDALSLHMFSLEVDDDDEIVTIHAATIHLGSDCKRPATALKFDGRGRLICATVNGLISILKISDSGSSINVTLDHVFKEHTVDWLASSHHFPIVLLDLSSDGKWLAAGRYSSGKGAVHVFTLTTDDGSERYQHWWSMPELGASTSCIRFLGGGSVESSLAVGCSNNEFYIYNLGRRSLSHWSNDMGLPLLKSLPKQLTSRSEPVSRIVPNPKEPQRFILGSHGYFCLVDLDKPVPERASMFPPDHLRAKKGITQHIEDETMMYFPPPPRKEQKLNPNHVTNLSICLRYREILFQDFISEDEMVIVDEPLISLMEELPDALARRVYGT